MVTPKAEKNCFSLSLSVDFVNFCLRIKKLYLNVKLICILLLYFSSERYSSPGNIHVACTLYNFFLFFSHIPSIYSIGSTYFHKQSFSLLSLLHRPYTQENQLFRAFSFSSCFLQQQTAVALEQKMNQCIYIIIIYYVVALCVQLEENCVYRPYILGISKSK